MSEFILVINYTVLNTYCFSDDKLNLSMRGLLNED